MHNDNGAGRIEISDGAKGRLPVSFVLAEEIEPPAGVKPVIWQLPLDTVAFDLDRRQALLTWRLAMAQTDAAKFILVDSRG
jgi:hypothetical protein